MSNHHSIKSKVQVCKLHERLQGPIANCSIYIDLQVYWMPDPHRQKFGRRIVHSRKHGHLELRPQDCSGVVY